MLIIGVIDLEFVVAEWEQSGYLAVWNVQHVNEKNERRCFWLICYVVEHYPKTNPWCSSYLLYVALTRPRLLEC